MKIEITFVNGKYVTFSNDEIKDFRKFVNELYRAERALVFNDMAINVNHIVTIAEVKE